MSGLAAVLFVAGVASVAYLIYAVTYSERSRKWRDAARAVGLAGVEARRFLNVEYALSGTLDGLRVTIEAYQRGKYEHGTRIVVGGFRHGAYQLSVRAEGVTSAIEKTFGEREIDVGDAAFDDTAYVQGAPALVRALFDEETRRTCGALLAGRIVAEGPGGPRTLEHIRASVSDNELRVELRSSLFDRTEDFLPSLLMQVVALGRRLRRPDDLAARIAGNAAADPEAGVRLACLRTLASDFPQQAATRAALLGACRDNSPDVRLHAASSLGPDGHETLRALAAAESGSLAARAIAALGPACDPAAAATRLRVAVAAQDAEVARACIEVLGRSGHATATGTLLGVLAAPDEGLAAAAARALGDLGAPAAEPALIEALGHESGEVRLAAAASLGRMGSPLAVVPLRNAAASHRLDGPLRRAAREAIVAIQGRVGGASPGQLSLADGEAGQVSLVDEDRQGQVSLQVETSPAQPAPSASASAATMASTGSVPTDNRSRSGSRPSAASLARPSGRDTRS